MDVAEKWKWKVSRCLGCHLTMSLLILVRTDGIGVGSIGDVVSSCTKQNFCSSLGPSRHDSNAAVVVTVVGQDQRLCRRMRNCIAASRSPSVIENRRDGDIFIWRVKNARAPSQATRRTPPLVRSKYEDPCSNLFSSHRIASSRIAIFGERLLRQTIILAVPRVQYTCCFFSCFAMVIGT